MPSFLQPNSTFLLIVALIGGIAMLVPATRNVRKGRFGRGIVASVVAGALLVSAGALRINQYGEYMPTWSDLKEFVSASDAGRIQVAGEGASTDAPDEIPAEAPAVDPTTEAAAPDAKETPSSTPTPTSEPTSTGEPHPSGNTKVQWIPITKADEVGKNVGGRYMAATYTGAKSGIKELVRIWVPDAPEGTVFDVVVFLHGYPATSRLTFANLKAANVMQELISEGKIRPTILVMPSLQVDKRPPDCVDIQGRPPVGTWVTKDIPDLIRENFNVTTDPRGWTLGGYSAGAYCAGVLSIIGSDTYGSGILLSGYNTPDLGSLSKASKAVRDEFTISNMVKDAKNPVRILVTGAGNDNDAAVLVKGVKANARAGDEITAYMEKSGAHNWKTWERQFPEALTWFGKISEKKPVKDVGMQYMPTRIKADDSSQLVNVFKVACGAAVLLFLAMLSRIWWNRRHPDRKEGARGALSWTFDGLAAFAGAFGIVLVAYFAVNIKMGTVTSWGDLYNILALMGYGSS